MRHKVQVSVRIALAMGLLFSLQPTREPFAAPRAVFAAPKDSQWSLGYWTGVKQQPLSDMDWAALTHLSQVAVAPNLDGSLTYTCSTGPCASNQFSVEASSLISAARAHGVKVLMNVGNVDGRRYRGAVRNALSLFVTNISNSVRVFGYDGVDIDWENQIDPNLMTTLVVSLRAALPDKLLTIDAGGDHISLWALLAPYLDRINAMTYDMAGNWNAFSWFNSALYGDDCECVWSYELMRQRMLAGGVPQEKLNFGIPFYGWISKGGGITGPRQIGKAISLRQINYSDLVTTYDVSSSQWDSQTHTPWVALGNGWITFDNPQSITDKVQYVRANNLGGWAIWEVEQDYLPSANPSHPLLDAIRNAR